MNHEQNYLVVSRQVSFYQGAVSSENIHLQECEYLRKKAEQGWILVSMTRSASDGFNTYYFVRHSLSKEMEIAAVIRSAREVQEYLWAKKSLTLEKFIENKETWIEVFLKRVNKIQEVDKTKNNYKVELKKRLLQQVALSLAALETLD